MKDLGRALEQLGVPSKYARQVGPRLGGGVEGDVFEIGKTRILKVNYIHTPRDVQKIVRGVGWAMKVFDEGPLLRTKGLGFWYVGERLLPIPLSDRYLLDRIGMIRLRKGDHLLSTPAARSEIDAVVRQMPPELAAIVTKMRHANYRDIHGGNVMLNAKGEYRVVDVESMHRIKQ